MLRTIVDLLQVAPNHGGYPAYHNHNHNHLGPYSEATTLTEEQSGFNPDNLNLEVGPAYMVTSNPGKRFCPDLDLKVDPTQT